MSNGLFIELDKIADKLSPYKMVSTAGRTFTEIGILVSVLKEELVKYKDNHVKIGMALKTNCPVNGTKQAKANNPITKNLDNKLAGFLISTYSHTKPMMDQFNISFVWY